MANDNSGQATLSAQNVGREFVRQYYTFMNAEPHHLHRFYSQSSSFVHGGVEKPGEEQPPVMGQSEIHKKIMSLNFRDCHTKIRQVDSQPTVGRGVVIQVTGELSNNGEPMRRFMQTFVLAPQGEKQYYVHNAVFRYQDEVFPEDEDDDTHAMDLHATEIVENGAPDIPVAVQEPQYYDQQPPQPLSNGAVQEELEPTSVIEEKKEPETNELEAEMDSLAMEEEQHYDEPEVAEPAETPAVEPETRSQPAEPQKQQFTWAALASKNTASTTSAASTPAHSGSAMPRPSRAVAESKPESAPVAAAAASPSMPGSSAAQPQPQRAARPPRETGRYERDRSNMSRDGDGDGEGRRPVGFGSGGLGAKYPDSQQLFVGNLPHSISEAELKVFFGHWGNVQDLRINTKSSGGKLPNFGFVVFDSPDAVQAVLKEKPIKFNGEHRLNVEEKKPRDNRMMSGRGALRGGGGGGVPRGGFTSRGGMKPGGGFGRPNDGERRSVGMGGPSRGGMSGGPQRR